MADQTLDQLPALTGAGPADLLYAVRDGADGKLTRADVVAGLVPATRAVAAGPGLKGGGDLSADRTLSLDVPALVENLTPVATADFLVVHETASGLPRKVRLDRFPLSASPQNTFQTIAVAGQSNIVADGLTDTLTVAAGANVTLTTSSVTDTLTIAAPNLVPASRNVGAGAGLSGGGDLSANRSLAVNIDGQPEDAAPALANHYLLSHDTATGSLRKLRASLLGGGTYVLPPATGSTLGGVRIGSGLSVDGNGTVTLNYTMPAASTVSLGGVRVGANLGVTSDGTLSANPPYALPVASAATLGGVRVGSGLSVDGAGTLSATASGGASYTLPVATASTLGGVKQGANVTVAGDGTISVAAPTPAYTLPPATAGTLGGVRVGSGLSVDGSGILAVTSGGGSYVLPAATASTLGGVKVGSGVIVAADGTISVASAGVGDNLVRPSGVTRGTGLADSVRLANKNAIQAAINALAAQGSGTLALGGGTIEIAGELVLSGGHNDVRVVDGQGTKLIQTVTGQNIVRLDGCRHWTVRNFELRYAAEQTTGASFSYDTALNPHAALRLKDSMMNRFENIAIRSAWCGIVADTGDPSGTGGGGSYSNSYSHIEINMGANSGWGYAQRRGTGSVINNMYITGNGQNVPCRGGVLLLSVGQTTFNQLNVEWLKCRYAVQVDAVNGLVINSPNIEGITPTQNGSTGFGVVLHFASLSTVTINGGSIGSTTFDQTANGISRGVLFSIWSQAHLEVRGMHIVHTVKVGTVQTALLGTDSDVPIDQAYASFHNITLRRTSTVDHYELDYLVDHTMAAGTTTNVDGPLRRFNNVLGGEHDRPVSWGDVSVTAYLLIHGNWQRFGTPLTAARTVTLANRIDAPLTDATKAVPMVPAGATMRVTRTAGATGTATLTVANHNGTAITTLALRQTAEFYFDGSNWSMLWNIE
jgi:hypothetical protein